MVSVYNSIIGNWAQLFKPNDVVSYHIIKTLIIKCGIYPNIFAEKMWVAFAFVVHPSVNIFSDDIS